jgi:hypothetical protein
MEISGKSKEECETAYRISRGNSDVAYELLLQGIPDDLIQRVQEMGDLPEPADDGYGDEYGGEHDHDMGDMGDDPFAALASNPNFENIRQRIVQDPAFYQQFMNQL